MEFKSSLVYLRTHPKQTNKKHERMFLFFHPHTLNTPPPPAFFPALSLSTSCLALSLPSFYHVPAHSSSHCSTAVFSKLHCIQLPSNQGMSPLGTPASQACCRHPGREEERVVKEGVGEEAVAGTVVTLSQLCTPLSAGVSPPPQSETLTLAFHLLA